jgi:hypothetical protein
LEKKKDCTKSRKKAIVEVFVAAKYNSAHQLFINIASMRVSALARAIAILAPLAAAACNVNNTLWVQSGSDNYTSAIFVDANVGSSWL